MTVCVLIGYKARSGKDTFTDYLATMLPGAVRTAFATKLKEVATSMQAVLGRPQVKDGRLLQLIGDLGKTQYGTDVWAATALEPVSTSAGIVLVSDFRFKIEYETALRMFSRVITINVCRVDRMIDRPADHHSETELDNFSFDIIVDNNGTIDELREQVTDIAKYIRDARQFEDYAAEQLAKFNKLEKQDKTALPCLGLCFSTTDATQPVQAVSDQKSEKKSSTVSYPLWYDSGL